MCTYVTEQRPVEGSGKAGGTWFTAGRATVYYDHPVHAQFGHTLNIDVSDREDPTRRVAVELSTASALDLLEAVTSVLARVPEDLTGVDPTEMDEIREALSRLTARPAG